MCIRDRLQSELDRPRDSADIRRFAGEFLRPHGIDQPVALVFADAIERTVRAGASPQAETPRAIVEDEPAAQTAQASDTGTGGTIVPLTNKKYDYALRVHTSPHSRRDTFVLDKGTLVWLWRDIDSGVGAYGMLAAKYH